jgi:hypothetical protein
VATVFLMRVTSGARRSLVLALAVALAGCAGASHQRPTGFEDGDVASVRGGRVPSGAGARHAVARGRDGDAPGPRTASIQPPAVGVPPGPPPAPLRDDDGALTAKIDRDTAPRRASALRLTEEARALLARDEAPRAIELLERAVAVDARTPYAYYFLAEAHERAQHPVLARSFVARAEQLFAGDPYWLGRVHALHGRIAEDEGRADEARAAYTRALAVWPRNGDAATGLARLDTPGQGAR